MSATRLGLGAGARIALGALAGVAGTVAMTALMRRLHRRLPTDERYPLPARELVERVKGPDQEERLATDTVLAHFAYGAATGALFGLAAPRVNPFNGALYGAAVWCASYLGWVPAVGALKPATDHPPRRSALMLGAHLVWGAATALSLRELIEAQRGPFAAGPLRDAPLDSEPPQDHP